MGKRTMSLIKWLHTMAWTHDCEAGLTRDQIQLQTCHAMKSYWKVTSQLDSNDLRGRYKKNEEKCDNLFGMYQYLLNPCIVLHWKSQLFKIPTTWCI